MHTAEADLYKQGNIYAQGGRRSAAGRMLTEAVIVEKLSRPQDYHNSMTEDLRAQSFKDSRSRALHRLQEVQCYFTVWYRVDYGRSKELPADVTTSHVRQEVWSIRAEKPFSSLTASTTASAQGLPSSSVWSCPQTRAQEMADAPAVIEEPQECPSQNT